MLKTTLSILLAASAFAASPEREIILRDAKQSAHRLAEYQKINARAVAAQNKVAAFMAGWVAECGTNRQPREDGGCRDRVPPPAPVSAPKAPSVKPPAETPAPE